MARQRRANSGSRRRKKRKEAYNTDHSRVVSDHSTTSAQRRLTSESGRDRVHSPWYDRRHWREGEDGLYRRQIDPLMDDGRDGETRDGCIRRGMIVGIGGRREMAYIGNTYTH